ncbi:uncharacterized protein MYCFIDRAFT_205789 [Pseudocercospora fijiensis CIRAD86]|uniref:Uncharacterized protein n=1 Tax=Pseudocercospora fijiensis (strain CIRAD86) TaxID=383855 RepID=N1QA34_PSEFD|nr:uncharacterized protein MYCFIDRAFT_205789 [Pseudocercospora fijiensis CIRAD86]EME87758.1 hypothetical protein MYCFIDRAFT_205789 [Pseudocercospora fijiensis CIRAD86]
MPLGSSEVMLVCQRPPLISPQTKSLFVRAQSLDFTRILPSPTSLNSHVRELKSTSTSTRSLEWKHALHCDQPSKLPMSAFGSSRHLPEAEVSWYSPERRWGYMCSTDITSNDAPRDIRTQATCMDMVLDQMKGAYSLLDARRARQRRLGMVMYNQLFCSATF